ncbi:MAG TPA: nitrogenase component 1, partial [Burkholderiaceae bacterium]|nr:nitrogenase component 1 [Burkholderiaceae bacterium]
REFAREVRDAAKALGLEALITDDYLEVEQRVAELHPELVLGTQMERHIAKRLGLPCAVISAPVHVQDFPARHAPQMGFEGANVLFDTWVQPLMMGLEEHLLTMFRGDFEFHEGAAASHLGRTAPAAPLAAVAPAHPIAPAVIEHAAPLAPLAPPRADVPIAPSPSAAPSSPVPPASSSAEAAARPAGATSAAAPPTGAAPPTAASWAADAERELQKIPFFVRGKARRNTERFALERGVALITVETLYDAKAHFSR